MFFIDSCIITAPPHQAASVRSSEGLGHRTIWPAYTSPLWTSVQHASAEHLMYDRCACVHTCVRVCACACVVANNILSFVLLYAPASTRVSAYWANDWANQEWTQAAPDKLNTTYRKPGSISKETHWEFSRELKGFLKSFEDVLNISSGRSPLFS